MIEEYRPFIAIIATAIPLLWMFYVATKQDKQEKIKNQPQTT
jgi:hypothetical protein